VVDGWKIQNEESSAWIILDEQRHVTAFSPQCTHLGCAYHWQAEKKLFTCPCHGSTFNIRGDVVTGPASRPLDRYSTKLENNRLWLGPLENSEGA
jgi:menaquinol-cytochrome c reductase iron-sulfur subunit